MGNNNAKALKSGLWYTATNFIVRGIGFFTTPIFTRLLSHSDYGLFSNYLSWLSIFTVFATLNLGASFISARFDYEKEFDSYVSSTLVLSSLATCFLAIIFNLFPEAFTTLTGLEIKYLNIMIVYLLLFSAVDLFQIRERYFFRYKSSSAISLLIAITTSILSVALVLLMDNKLYGRIIGSALPTVILGIIIYILLVRRGKKINTGYWKYALAICIPYIPHALSLFLLNGMDKVMITNICGAEANALYSVAYSCGAVITLLVTSMNTAFAPWLGEKLNVEEYAEIRTVSKSYILLFVFGAIGIMLLTPELLLLMGGQSYYAAIYVMPPVAFGCVCQFIYTMYVNVEQFKKKTIGMAIASIIAAILNFILNALLIPQFGYVVAAYTTLISYAALLFIHMGLVKHMKLAYIYPSKLVFGVLIFMTGYLVAIHFLFANSVVRYIILIVYAVLCIHVFMRKKDTIMRWIKK